MTGPIPITAGPDGGVWFTFGDGPIGIGRIDPSSPQVQQFSAPAGYGTLSGLVLGHDGNLWSGADVSGFGKIVRISTSGVFSAYRPGIKIKNIAASAEAQGASYILYGVGVNSSGRAILRFNEARLNALTPIPLPDPGHNEVGGMAIGHDGNLWITDPYYPNVVIQVYLIRQLTVSPSLITEPAGQSTGLTATETKTPPSKLRATSSDPSVASVANGQTAGAFTVTGVSAGTCTVKIFDGRGNLVNVPVTIN